HRQVKVAQLPRRLLGVDERFDIGVIAAQRRHHGAAARAGRKQRRAHRVPDAHERDRSGSDAADGLGFDALRTQSGEVVADAAALLHGQRAFLQAVEYSVHGIFDDAHHETVEERYAPIGAGPGLNPPAGEKTEVFEDGVESVFPAGRLLFHRRQRARDAPPRVLDRAVADGVAATEAILRVPDMARNVGVKRVAVHGGYVTRGRTAAARKRAVPRVGNDKQPGGDLSRIG